MNAQGLAVRGGSSTFLFCAFLKRIPTMIAIKHRVPDQQNYLLKTLAGIRCK
jgi:hypothetical protein